MALNQYFSASYILHQIEIKDREELFLKFAEKAYTTNLISDKTRFNEALIQQENRSASGMEMGVAISHIRTPLTRKSFMMMATLKQPINFGTLDGSLTNIVILLCAPPDENHIYIQLLARISRVLQNLENRQAILSTIGPNALYQLIETHGNWEITIEQAERYLLRFNLLQEEYFDAVVECLLELGLIHAQITQAVPLRNYFTEKLLLISHPDSTEKSESASSIIITCIVADQDILNKFSNLLKSRDIDLSQPGVGVVSITKISNMIGGVHEELNF